MSSLAEARAAALAREAARTASREAIAEQRKSDWARPRRSTEELRALAREGEELFSGSGIGAVDESSYDQIIDWVARTFGYRTAVACSMADAVLPHTVQGALPWVDVLFLETGYHFAETLGTRNNVENSMELTIVDVQAAQSVAEQDAAHGKDLWSRNPALCCQLRKMEPLTASLKDYEVWITGVRRDEAPTRTNTPLITFDEKNGLVKVNPLAAWSLDELLGYAAANNVIINPLLNDGYPSIGCQPCTKRVAPGEDPRSGRWAGLDKTECGLHV
jgi:phosphoadenosine phosphosulfate reductase